jgi:hypothetical protein
MLTSIIIILIEIITDSNKKLPEDRSDDCWTNQELFLSSTRPETKNLTLEHCKVN